MVSPVASGSTEAHHLHMHQQEVNMRELVELLRPPGLQFYLQEVRTRTLEFQVIACVLQNVYVATILQYLCIFKTILFRNQRQQQ